MGEKIYTKAEREKIEQAAAKSHATEKHMARASTPLEAPVDEQRALVKLGDATKMLAEVRDAPSAKKLMDVAAAAELYAKKAKLGADAVQYAAGIKLDAERRLGEYLKPLPEAKPGPKPELISTPETNSRLKTYKDIGITPKLAAEAQRLADIPDETFARVKSGEIKPSMAFREQKRATLHERVAALPAGKFRVIYADPPWKYGDERTGLAKGDTAAAAQYPTMPTVEICDLAPFDRPIRHLAADDAVLFMWATFPLLEDALQVIDEWGFKYKTAFVWDKQRSNIGNYHDARAELLMIATRGSCPIEIDTRPSQVQSIARGKHSAKPEEFRQLIDKLYPTGPRVELFRRGEAPAGWVVWGNESTEAA